MLNVSIRASYAPLIVLHGSLVLRILGDLSEEIVLRQWGGMFNVIAILLFISVIFFIMAQIGCELGLRLMRPLDEGEVYLQKREDEMLQ